MEQARKRHAAGQLFENGTVTCAPSEEKLLAELVEDGPSPTPRAENDVADFDDVQDDEEGEFDEAAAMREDRKPLQDHSHRAALRIVCVTGPPVREKARN